MAERKIITHNEYPPIPIRQFDWCAYYDGDEELSENYGWGATEDAAKADLLNLGLCRLYQCLSPALCDSLTACDFTLGQDQESEQVRAFEDVPSLHGVVLDHFKNGGK